ncbi:MAG: glutamate-5-semialdehyde dehydrogenase [Pseudomonadota bacterium]
MQAKNADDDIAVTMHDMGAAARKAQAEVGRCNGEQRDAALSRAAQLLRERADEILAANREDVTSARDRQLSAAMLDRLLLDRSRIEAMASGLDSIVALPDPLGRVLAEWERPNGLQIQRVSVPLGVIGIVYESRPNVTADAAALCLKSGNAVILRGGSESFHSSSAIHRCVQEGLEQSGVPRDAVQMVPTTDRAAVGYLLASLNGAVDVVVPRGGRSLIERVQRDARVPVIGHLEGLCHVYLHESADVSMATDIVVNAKLRRTGICGAAETLLVDRGAAERLLPPVVEQLVEGGCEVRGDAATAKICSGVATAEESDWTTEYLDSVIACRVVSDVGDAIAHINRYGSGHTDCIVSADSDAAERFLDEVDSAIVLHNASTQFADGGEFGMGAEIGIATGRIHARGPVGADQLTSYKYRVSGTGQVRP